MSNEVPESFESAGRPDTPAHTGVLGSGGHGYNEDETHVSPRSPEQFYAAIINMGYGAIATSRSHSFGEFQMLGGVGVLQQVNLIDADQALYLAIYQLVKEPAGWRVQGVQLVKTTGVGV